MKHSCLLCQDLTGKSPREYCGRRHEGEGPSSLIRTSAMPAVRAIDDKQQNTELTIWFAACLFWFLAVFLSNFFTTQFFPLAIKISHFVLFFSFFKCVSHVFIYKKMEENKTAFAVMTVDILMYYVHRHNKYRLIYSIGALDGLFILKWTFHSVYESC